MYIKYFADMHNKFMNKQVEILKNTYKIEEIPKKELLLSIMADKYCRAIIRVTKDKPKSAIEITNETKIPISTIYRRLQTMHDNNLLRTSGMITDDGKKLFLYKSKIGGIISIFENDRVEVKLISNP